MCRGGEAAHIYARLRQNDLRAAPGDPGHLANLRNGRLEPRHVRFRHPLQFLNAFVQVVDVVENLRQQSPLQRRDDSIQSRHDFVQLGTVQLPAALFDDALTVAGQFPQLPLFPAGNEAGLQKAVLEQLRNPLCPEPPSCERR